MKPTFKSIYRQSTLLYDEFVREVQKTGVTRKALDDMLEGRPVRRDFAESVLAVFSEETGQEWNLDTVNVSLLGETKS